AAGRVDARHQRLFVGGSRHVDPDVFGQHLADRRGAGGLPGGGGNLHVYQQVGLEDPDGDKLALAERGRLLVVAQGRGQLARAVVVAGQGDVGHGDGRVGDKGVPGFVGANDGDCLAGELVVAPAALQADDGVAVADVDVLARAGADDG